ncbi:cob(I)yrinic acid a,c-diamide adenosyltransferase [Flectobacillus major]|jgi:cob(I)alamin adenosyltransferase|uniref:cob(I)yrinic acid a,c-diamide adenosyltransferase n=1 Tax=Flectobacillus major TaxID=103 RepID=UPI0003FF0605|nr:cob(I)yrinic acid a,c-diamide adenosyltransferase [Flectobacillus major]
MKIYTKTGDKGSTSLVGGTRILKSELRIEAYGTIDELNSYIGLLGDQVVNQNKKELLKEIQDRLFTIGSILASEPEQTKKKIPDLHDSDIELLEKAMDTMNEKLEAMRFFILPGGHQSVSFGHIARTVCRRAERMVVRLSEESDTDYLVIRYLNRLSDYLFILCRYMAKELGVEEVAWKARV